MMRSLYSAVSGLKTHQTKMDVIGNNIANVNTTAFKSQSVTFSDLMYQTTQKASGANANTGRAGINARQIGLGVKTGAISTAIEGQGSAQTTNNPFDIMITGSAFFVVSDGSNNYFTRDGSFYVDGKGNLAMTSNGYTVMGWQVDKATQTIKQDTVSALQIMTEGNMTYPPEATTKALVAGIIDKGDDNFKSGGKVISLDFYDDLGYKYTAKFNITGPDATSTPGETKFKLSLTNVTGADGKDYTAGFDAISGKDFIYDSGNGTFKSIDGSSTLDLVAKTDDQYKNFKTISMDFTETSMYNNNGTSTISMYSGDSKGLGAGRSIGEMSGVTIQTDGMIYASYDNGMTRLLGQIAVAEFSNASGLEKAGDNLYSATLNSGAFDGIGVDITANSGYMTTGVLEMSNVDLSQEFTEMITTQRGFQANSRIITVSDTMLEELTNLKR